MIKNEISITNSARILELDGLRGIAILLVISFHYINNQLVNTPGRVAFFLQKATGFGWVGVDLFFVLSGFLIGNIILKNAKFPNFLRVFYLRRILRIIPNYFLLVSLFAIITNLPFFKGSVFLSGNDIIPIWSYYLMIHNFFMANLQNMGNASMSITWSIGIEEQFYIVFPWLIMFVSRKYLPLVLIILIFLSSFFRGIYESWIPAYVLLYCRMDALCFGILVAYLLRTKYLTYLATKYYHHMLFLILLDASICGFLFYRYGDLGPFKQTLFSIVFSILLILALERKTSIFASLLRNPILNWIGSISYSLYLFHYLILGCFHYLISGNNYIGIHNNRDIIVSIAALVTSILFSYVVYKKLESPFVNFGKRFKY